MILGISYRVQRTYRMQRIYRVRSTYRKTTALAEDHFMDNISLRDLAVQFVVDIDQLCLYIEGRSVFKNQLLRAASSIGANIHEAKYGQSRADFISKFEIALKECYETEYWLEILFKVNAISQHSYKTLQGQAGTIRRKLIASITTAKGVHP